MIEEKLVTTINNEKVKREDSRYIDGDYYKIGDINIENSGDCYKINGRYRRVSTGHIVFDNTIKQYVLKSNNYIYENQVIGFDENNKPIFGDFSDAYGEVVNFKYKGSNYFAINEEIFKNNLHFKEYIKNNIFVERNSIDAINFNKIPNCDPYYKNGLPYNCSKVLNKKIDKYNSFLEKNYYSENVTILSQNLKDLTFGVEFETNKGFIPDNICDKNGLIPLRDGSVQGLEYVTIPLQGKRGIKTLLNSLKQLKKRTTYDKDCSLHFHIGNIPRTEEFMLALFKTLCYTQDEMFELFPLYKKYNFGYKRKHYTKPFSLKETIFNMDSEINKDNIKKNFNILFQYLSMGIPYDRFENDLSKVNHHPSDPDDNRKWQVRSRYHYINMIPLLFGNKKTIEFRIHNPTYNENKVINYLLLCCSIINFVKENTDKILKNSICLRDINFYEIFYSTLTNEYLIESISNYINTRKDIIYSENKNENIFIEEDDIITNPYPIDWETENSILKVKRFRSSMEINEDLLRRLHEITDSPQWIGEPQPSTITTSNPFIENNDVSIL